MPAPRDAPESITVYGRNPVLEALADESIAIERVLVARTARGDSVDDILDAARRRGIAVQRVSPDKVTRISGNGRHDQGVVADVAAPGVTELDVWLAAHDDAPVPGPLLLLDGVTNPANVGMVIRTATAAGLLGIILPRAGCPDLGPLVIKASAGVAFRATVLRAATAADAARSLRDAGAALIGLRGGDAPSLFTADLPAPAAYVLGNESEGVSAAVAGLVDGWRTIPMAGGVESLNIAVAAGVLCFELARRAQPA